MRRLLSALLLLTVTVFAFAQTSPASETLLRGYGSITSDDALDELGEPSDRYTFSVPIDGTVSVLVVSADFAPRLRTETSSGTVRETSGRANAARVELSARAGETISAVVSDTSDGEQFFAAYTIVATIAPAGAALAPGSVVRGRLTEDDETDDDGSFIDWYELSVETDSRVRVAVTSVEFDTYLVVELPDGRVLENDDSDGTDSALTLAIHEPGAARVGVTSFGYASTGGYTVEVASVEERTISVGRLVRGSLDAAEDIYVLSGDPGDTVAVELRSDDFDTYLELEADDGTYLYNDDADGISVSRLVHELGPSGEAVITVSSFGGGTGSYELEVDPYRYDGPLLEDGYPLADGDVVTGRLGPHVPLRNGSYVQRFTFRAEPGERVEIVLRSDDFDSYLRVTTPRGEEVADDDSGGGLDSRIVLTAEERGMYEVLASDLGGGSLGSYTLSFSRLSDARLLLNTSGELSREDRADVRGNYYDIYRFDVTAGRLVTVDIMSDDFDGYAVVRAGERRILYRDDDGGGSGNPRISFTAERSQTLELIVTTYSPESTGRYTVSIYE